MLNEILLAILDMAVVLIYATCPRNIIGLFFEIKY
jgi:hypothetical protein